MKNIYIAIYNFPPIGIGRGIAWCKFASMLSNNYRVRIITVEPSVYDPYYNEDKKKLYENENFEVIRLRDAKFYYKAYSKKREFGKSETKKRGLKNKFFAFSVKLYKRITRFVFYPDRMKFWSKEVCRYLKQVSKTEKIDLVISVGFPFSSHLYLSKLKKKLNYSLVLDYGDPWSFNPSKDTEPSWRRKIDYFAEKKMLKRADFVTVTTENTKKKFIEKFPFCSIEVIRQGVCNADYAFSIADDIKEVVLVYTGIFYKEIRNPKRFFESLCFIDNQINFPVRILIAGRMDLFIDEMIQSLHLHSFKNISVEFLGNVNYDKCISLQSSANALLFFSNDGNVQVPGKLYEYFATNKPIVCISYHEGETEELIQKHKRGYILYNSSLTFNQELLEILQHLHYKDYPKDMETVVIDYDWNEIGKKVCKIVDDIVGGNIDEKNSNY